MRFAAAMLGALMTISTLGACAAPAGRSEGLSELPAGTRWALEDSSLGALKAAREGAIHIAFDNDRLSGDSGCNQFSAEARVEGGKLELGPIVASKRACIGPGMDAERALFDALAKIESAAIDGDRLTLGTRDGQSLIFARAGKGGE
ncbi:META domain-containing protein [Pseudomarimonas salicorniae]|uniref:META domain-containing protein n=1 Tax=Pseudomarimonas salicorniae TaxID=2933270 RepID=A0ABT0GHP2_9GAMM|nr:META domain-containing protein [Lysobacter sp. CAU 1642]MCK7594065.1 META domain-containing protein [Lysobacter sp. CAU 1642]